MASPEIVTSAMPPVKFARSPAESKSGAQPHRARSIRVAKAGAPRNIPVAVPMLIDLPHIPVPPANRASDTATGTLWVSTLRAEPAIITQQARPSENRFSLYAYNYWRWPITAPVLATAGQYGGSQSGLIAHYRLWTTARLDARLRLAATPQANGEREAALGFRWQPMTSVPVQIIGERRFRANAPDAFAIGIAGGSPPAQLPFGFSLESYGQAGWVSGAAGGYYFDASAQASKRLLDTGGVRLSLGGAAWAGGQKDAVRLDAGPRLDLRASPGGVPLRLSADWRFRLTGDAIPKSGPALTLSASF